MGDAYRYGPGAKRDPKEARRWYEMAAAKQQAEANRKLGEMYATGEGGRKDKKKALENWKAAEAGGDPLAPILVADQMFADMTRGKKPGPGKFKIAPGTPISQMDDIAAWYQEAEKRDPRPEVQQRARLAVSVLNQVKIGLKSAGHPNSQRPGVSDRKDLTRASGGADHDRGGGRCSSASLSAHGPDLPRSLPLSGEVFEVAKRRRRPGIQVDARVIFLHRGRMSADQHVVILGAGHAGGTAAALLRQYGFEGPITLIGAEPIPPYQRPPLSKAWLKGEADADSLALKPLEFYAEHAIDFRPSTTATALNRGQKTVALSDGSSVSYDTLVLATGARAIALPIPGADLSSVMFLRTAADAELLKATVGPGKTLAVVGGGYIGLEVAASGRALGAEVVVIEREERLLARVACETLADVVKAQHEAHGVTFELGATATAFEGDARGHVTGVKLADGRVIALRRRGGGCGRRAQ